MCVVDIVLWWADGQRLELRETATNCQRNLLPFVLLVCLCILSFAESEGDSIQRGGLCSSKILKRSCRWCKVAWKMAVFMYRESGGGLAAHAWNE